MTDFAAACPHTYARLVALLAGQEVREARMQQMQDDTGPFLRVTVCTADAVLTIDSREPWESVH